MLSIGQRLLASEDRFARINLGGFWLVDPSEVNLDDLLRLKPGAILRTRNMDAIRYVAHENDMSGCIAGWISDDDC